MMNHRESWAEERRSPSQDEWVRQQSEGEKREPRSKKAPVSLKVGDAPKDQKIQSNASPQVILRRKS
jgi:hypothetical protein